MAKKKVKFAEIGKLGYRLSERQIPLGGTPHKEAILEVINVDTNRPASFCFLFSIKKMEGVVLDQPYAYYELHRPRNHSAFLTENELD